MTKKLEFKEDTHQYFVNGEEYTSVTKWIDSHFPEFNPDAEFYHRDLGKTTLARYVAHCIREEIRNCNALPDDEFLGQTIPKSLKLFGDSVASEIYSRRKLKVPITAREVKKLWIANGEAARDEGTITHQMIEDAIKFNMQLEDYMEEPAVVAAMNTLFKVTNNFGGCVIEPERRVYSESYKLAGTIDVLLTKANNKVILIDWKTNNELSWNGYNKGLTPATKKLTDSKLQRYTLQLSTYAYILEKEYGREVKKLLIVHLTEDGAEEIEVEYQKSLVEEMLNERVKEF